MCTKVQAAFLCKVSWLLSKQRAQRVTYHTCAPGYMLLLCSPIPLCDARTQCTECLFQCFRLNLSIIFLGGSVATTQTPTLSAILCARWSKRLKETAGFGAATTGESYVDMFPDPLCLSSTSPAPVSESWVSPVSRCPRSRPVCHNRSRAERLRYHAHL